MIKDVFIWLLERNDKFEILHIGHSDAHRSLAQILEIPEKAIKTTNLSGYEQYKQNIQFDIGLCSINKKQF